MLTREVFFAEVERAIEASSSDAEVRKLSLECLRQFVRYKYTYRFRWLGAPITQIPEDVMALQELIWQVKPEAIVETGVAEGGTLLFYASLLKLISEDNVVVGIDTFINDRVRERVETNPLHRNTVLVEGSSIDEKVVERVFAHVEKRQPTLVVLDSNHAHAHVLAELEKYSPLVTKGGYIVVLDTVIEDLPDDSFPERPWGRGNNPGTAVREFLRENKRFEIDEQFEKKLFFTTARGGFLKCVG